jgi:hypothetical protein
MVMSKASDVEALMPLEIIGEVGTPGAETEWIEAQGKLAIQHLKESLR